MKRSFLYLAAGALALSACTSENVLEDAAKSYNAIGFENVVNKHTRADLTSGNMDRFCVFGYYTTPSAPTVAVPVFENVTVYRQDNGSWSYLVLPDGKTSTGAENRYWLLDSHYYFYAYNCGNVDKLNDKYGTFTMNMNDDLQPSDRVLKINNYVCDDTHQHDLVFASNTGAVEGNAFAGILGKTTGNSNVALQFKHILAKVQAQFTSSFPEGYEVTISDVSFENIRNVGDYNPNAANGWQNVRRPEGEFPCVHILNTEDPKVNPITTKRGGAPAQTNSAYVIPYQYNGQDATEESKSTWVYIKFTINVKNKGQVVLTSELSGKLNPNWVAGYTYTYNIDLSGSAANLQAIAFTTVTDEDGKVVSDWLSDGEEDPVITIDKN